MCDAKSCGVLCLEEFTCDNIGNPLTFDGASFAWAGRELAKYEKDGKVITFKYDENGLRHRKTITENDVITEQYDYVWSDGTLISQTYTDLEDGTVVSTDTARFIYDSWGTLQGFILNDSETYLYVKNLQGDIIAIVDELGEVIVEYSYDAWGNVTFHETSLQNMTKASTLCFVSPFTYRGYCYDYDIELYYLQSRYYSAEIGRFINTDDTQIAIATQGEILGANLFAYCNNNPINKVDYTGYSEAISSLVVAFTLKYGVYLSSGVVLIGKLTAFLSAVAPYLLAAIAIVAATYLTYKVIQKATISSVSKKIPNKLKTKDGRVDLKKFNKKLPNGGGWKGPDGWKIVKDLAKHAGSVWKLLNKNGDRIATLWEDGRIRGK